jgi:hypothetical protein
MLQKGSQFVVSELRVRLTKSWPGPLPSVRESQCVTEVLRAGIDRSVSNEWPTFRLTVIDLATVQAGANDWQCHGPGPPGAARAALTARPG